MKTMACSKMWTSINVQPDRKQIKTCCHRKGPSVTTEELLRLGASVFIDHPYNMADRAQFIDQNQIPDSCKICKDSWPNSLWDIWNSWRDRDFTADQLAALKTADLVEKIEIALSNKCNQTCMYCYPERSSDWAKIMGREITEDEAWNAAFKAALHDYIRLHVSQRATEISYNMLGGEPLLNPDLYEFIDSIITAHEHDKHPTRLREFVITTNLNVKPALVQRLLDVIDQTPGWHWRIKCSIDAIGAVGETIRDGLSVAQYQENLELILGHPRIYVEILPSVSVLSIPAFAEMLAWAKAIMHKHGLLDQHGHRWQFGVNMVEDPSAMHPGNLSDSYKHHIDDCIAELMELPEHGMKTKLLRHMENILRLIGTRTSAAHKAQMRTWFIKQGELKKRDYWQDFALLTDLLGPR